MGNPSSVQLYVRMGGPGGQSEERIFMKTPFSLKDTCKGLPSSRWHPGEKAWHVPATTASAAAIVKAFRFEQIEMDQRMHDLIDSTRRQIDAQDVKRQTDLPPIPVRTDAWMHQRQAFHFAKQLDAAMLAMDMGTGKSLTAIALLQEWDARMVLILCPVSVVGVWPKQFREHALKPEEWLITAPQGRATVIKRADDIAAGILRARRLDKRCVCVINYEASWRAQMQHVLNAVEWDVIMLDESHRVKSAGGKQSTYASALRKHSRRRLALTGTPMPHSPLDIYAQYRFLDPGIFGSSKNRFQNRYAIMGGYENRQVKGWQNEDELIEKFSSIAFVISKEDALPDLPEKMPPMERSFVLAPKARTVYKQMADDFIVGVDEGMIVANNALSRTLRLRQIVAGHSKTEDGRIVHLDDGRENLLKDVLSDLPDGEPVVVFGVFHPDLDAIARVTETMGLRYGELSGRRRDGITADATMSPDIDILGAQLKSGGVGIDLTRAAYAIYYTVGYELGDYDQSQDRLHRPGQTRPVRYIHLTAEQSIDQVVYKALRARKNVTEAILEAAKAREL